ncbi:MAG: penicillin-binding protein 2 [Patescibacteria group bacterium]|nr:penicillin-binding protein 2 [Patescibacteria group bacterium]MDE1965716.1 penicillin-binding protein 2 [Patescibacteria group bacterium]
MRRRFKVRLRILVGALLVIAAAIVLRLYFVQIVYGGDYSLMGERQYLSQAKTLYDRGSIFFTTKDGTLVSAATIETGFLVAIDPETLTDPQAAYAAISAAASTTEADFMAHASKKNDPYEEIVDHVSEAAGEALAAKRLPGVLVLRDRWRTYPAGTEAAKTIGFVAYDNDNTLSGRYGLERYYDTTLTRDSGSLYRNFFAELFANVGDLVVDARSARQGDLITTIEPEVEARLVTDLAKVDAEYHSKSTGGIIMVPSTGEIIALGTDPTFDPNTFASGNAADFGNPLVEHVYEFGSIMKSLTMASGLDAGVITPDTTYKDSACITVDSATICNWDLKAHGTIPMQQILSQSLNVGASWVATELGPEKFRSYFTALQFGEPTGVDLPAETHGLVGNLSSPRQLEYDTASFGQGIAITPFEMIRALGTLANDGAMVRPHIVKAIRLDSGVTRPLDWSGTLQVFKPQTVAEVTKMLTVVASTALAHGADRMPDMSFAVKTGTAQLTKPGGGYYTNRFFHSFFGYFPSYAPRFIILLYTNDPQGVEYASQTLTSTYLDLMHFLIDYYQIPPDGTATTTLNRQ